MSNVAIVTGRLASNPNYSTFDEDGQTKERCFFIVASQNKYADSTEDVSWIPCVIFGEGAKNLHKYCKKGDWVEVEGHNEGRYVSYGSGEKRIEMRVKAHFVQYGPKARQNLYNEQASKQRSNINAVVNGVNEVELEVQA